MIWAQLAMSIIIWAGWIAAITYLSEPLADKIAPTVARFHKGWLDDDWTIACYVAAMIVAILAGLACIGVWWVYVAVFL